MVSNSSGGDSHGRHGPLLFVKNPKPIAHNDCSRLNEEALNQENSIIQVVLGKVGDVWGRHITLISP